MVKQTMAEPLEVRILDLVAELLAHALRILSALKSARAISTGALQAILNCLHDFFVWVKRDLHVLLLSFHSFGA